MQQYVAFLRGINVGGHRVKMDRLRALFEEMEFSNVSTFIASGNVLFSSTSDDVQFLRDTIGGRLAERLGYEVETFIRSPAELETVAAFEPTGGAAAGQPDSSLYVIFLHAPPADLRTTLAGLNSDMDIFTVSGREIYWQIQGKMSESPLFGTGIGKAIRGVQNTTRNITTLRRLVAKLESA